METKKNIVIVAGEESGDQHASKLVKNLKSQHKNWSFTGIGGRHLQDAGVELLANLAQYSVTGVSEVIRHLPLFRRAFRCLTNYLAQNPVDLVILVDYPSFNLRLARYIKKHYRLQIVYYISPQIWAWKANRLQIIKKVVDHMAVILPFEKSIYETAGVPVSYVGHPLVQHIQYNQDRETLRKSLNLPHNKQIVALLPGSRKNEIVRLMPVLLDTMHLLLTIHPDLHFAIPVAGSLDPSLITRYLSDANLPVHIFHQQAPNVIAASDCVVVASGTASLECALLSIPGCIIYKASGLTAVLAKKFIKIPYLGLANIIHRELLMPELLQENCTPQAICAVISELLTSPEYYKIIQSRLLELRSSLSLDAADCCIEQVVEACIN